MSSSVNDQFSNLLNSLHSSSITSNETSNDLDKENLFVWQPVPFTKLSASNSIASPSVIETELPASIVSNTNTNTLKTELLPTNVLPQIVTNSNASVASTYPLSSIVQPPPLNQYYNPAPSYNQVPSYYAPPHPPSPSLFDYRLNQHPPQFHPSHHQQNPLQIPSHQYLNSSFYSNDQHLEKFDKLGVEKQLPERIFEQALSQTQQNPEEIKKDKIPSSFIWLLYIGGFLLILIFCFTLLWYFYVKDYNKYKLQKNANEEKEEESTESELLPPPLIASTFMPSKLAAEDKEIVNEAEVLIKNTFSDDEEDEDEHFNVENVVNFLEKKQNHVIEEEEKLVAVKKQKKSYFDLSDVDSSEFMQPVPEKKQVFGKLSDESPEVNEYAERRANLLNKIK